MRERVFTRPARHARGFRKAYRDRPREAGSRAPAGRTRVALSSWGCAPVTGAAAAQPLHVSTQRKVTAPRRQRGAKMRHALLLCVVAALAAVRGAAGATLAEMILVKYDLTRFPLAVCNDGSAGAQRPTARRAAAP